MRFVAAAFACLALAAPAAGAPGDIVLKLGHPLRAGETVFLDVQVGPIARGRTIEITTASGTEIGTISPYGTRLGQDAGSFAIPVPPESIHDGQLTVRMMLSQPGGPPRPVLAGEVKRITLATAPPAP